MFLPTLLALATGVFPGPRFGASPRVIVYVKHSGPPRTFQISVRTKNPGDNEWIYYRNLRHIPIRLRTSATGRRVVLSLPSELKEWSQVCSFLPQEKSAPSSSLQAAFSLESCANLP